MENHLRIKSPPTKTIHPNAMNAISKFKDTIQIHRWDPTTNTGPFGKTAGRKNHRPQKSPPISAQIGSRKMGPFETRGGKRKKSAARWKVPYPGSGSPGEGVAPPSPMPAMSLTVLAKLQHCTATVSHPQGNDTTLISSTLCPRLSLHRWPGYPQRSQAVRLHPACSTLQ